MDNQFPAQVDPQTDVVQPPKSNPLKSIIIALVCGTVGVGFGLAITFANADDGKSRRSVRKSRNGKHSFIQWLTGSDKAFKSRKKKTIGPFDSVLDPDFDYEATPAIQTEYSSPQLPSAFN